MVNSFFNKNAKAIQQEKASLQKIVLEYLDIHIQNKEPRTLHPSVNEI